MAAKPKPDTILTANRLDDGAVVYLTRAGGWSEWLEDGEVADSEARALELLTLGAARVGAHQVVDPYLIAVRRDGYGVEPLGQREIIRAKGPSVRLDLGKQAVPAAQGS